MNEGITENSELRRIAAELERGTRVISLSGLTSTASKAFVLSHLGSLTNKRLVIITESNRDLENFENDLLFWSNRSGNKQGIISVPSFETDIYSGVSPHA